MVLQSTSFPLLTIRILVATIFVHHLLILFSKQVDATVVSSSPFRIVIDGGSTGSRLHIFEFVHDPLQNRTECIRRGSSKAWTPLSTFGRLPSQLNNTALNATQIAYHLLPLFQYAADIIPLEYHSTTSVKYQATAGMRLLDESEQNAVYDTLHRGLLEDEGFVFHSFARCDIETLGGDKEGFYGAVAANYLKGVIDVYLHLTNANCGDTLELQINEFRDVDYHQYGPLGALDMGGSSTQIVFLPPASRDKIRCQVADTQLQSQSVDDVVTSVCIHLDDSIEGVCPISTRLNGEEFFSSSYLSYGADQFRERLWDTWVSDRKTMEEEEKSCCSTKTILNPCAFRGFQMEWKGYVFIGTGDAKECAHEVNRLIPHHEHVGRQVSYMVAEAERKLKVGGIEHPPVRGKFFAMSLYFFTLDCLRELSSHEGLNLAWPTPSIDELTSALDDFCSRHWQGDLEEIQHAAHKYTRAEVLPDRCFESVYMVTLLRDGFGFDPTSRDITFTYLVDGNEVDWALGTALASFAQDDNSAVSIRSIKDIELGEHEAEDDVNNELLIPANSTTHEKTRLSETCPAGIFAAIGGISEAAL